MTSLVLGFCLVGCGANDNSTSSIPSNPGHVISESQIVVKSRATVDLSAGSATYTSGVSNSRLVLRDPTPGGGILPIGVVNSPSSVFGVDTTNWLSPKATTGTLDFGYMTVSTLSDNDLDRCGTSGTDHCGTALIRVYTTGEAGGGLYNSAGGYGAPLKAGPLNSSLENVGLNSNNAAIVNIISLGADQHVLNLSDFQNLDFQFQSDFSNAGAGTYKTTIIIEYALAP